MATIIDVEGLAASKIRALFYGKGGSGKTRLVGSAGMSIHTAPALMVSIGGNPISIRGYDKLPTMVDLEELKELDSLYDFFVLGQPKTNSWWTNLKMEVPFKSLILDGCSRVQQQVMDMITGNKSHKVSVAATRREMLDYGKNLDTMGPWANQIFSLADNRARLPVHVFMTALEHDPSPDTRSKEAQASSINTPSPTKAMYRPLFFGQVLNYIEADAYIIGRMVQVERMRGKLAKPVVDRHAYVNQLPQDAYSVCLLQQTLEYMAKDQYGRLGSYLVNPTVDLIANMLYGKEPIDLTNHRFVNEDTVSTDNNNNEQLSLGE